MVTQEYIDGLPSVANLITLLEAIPSVLRAEAKTIDNPDLAAISHESAIQFSVYVDKKIAIDASPNLVPVIVNPEDFTQEIGFSMPPNVYNDEDKGHAAIVRAMKERINEYYAVGKIKDIVV